MTHSTTIIKSALLSLISILLIYDVAAQTKTISFQKLTVQQGLNDGMVNAMAQDARGYMWFASLGGLNRFDGKRVKHFTHRAGDSSSLPNQVPYSLAAGIDHALWVGYIDGLRKFDSRTGKCENVPPFANDNIIDIALLPDKRVLVLTRKQLLCYQPLKNRVEPLLANADKQTTDLLSKRVYGFFLHKQELLLGVDDGVIMLDLQTGITRWLALPLGSGAIGEVGTDVHGNFWALNVKANKIWCINRKSGNVASFDWLLQRQGESRLATLTMMAATGKPEIWIGTLERGLIGYNTTTGQASYHQHEPERAQSLSANSIRQMYQAVDGTLWLNTMHGVDYFEPGEALFERFKPYASITDPELGRGINEDKQGNLWLTSLRGISRLAPVTGNYKTWRNESNKPTGLYNNSVRATAEDEMGRVWIATASGVNRLDPVTGKMEFLTEADGLPIGFYFSINKDRQGRLWFGSRDNDGFYYYDPSDKRIYSVAQHPTLQQLTKAGGRYVMEDSRGRLWFGCNGQGLAMYNPVDKSLRRWVYEGRLNDSSIANNLVIDIKEDRNGVVWVTSFGGLSGIDLAKNKVDHFTDQNGLKSNITGSLAVDASNRLWVGTSAGLLLIDSTRKRLRYFNEEDGLPVVEMPEHPAILASNGDVIMPTIHGYIRFNPKQYLEPIFAMPCYVSDVASFNSGDRSRLIEHPSTSIELKPQENFFTISLEAINFKKPSQTWYAYKLEGFDKEWRYTQDANAVYTNVPGGKYTFLYKASTDRNRWEQKAGQLNIAMGTIFYKAVWFWTLVLLLAVALTYSLYKRKIKREREWMLLESKTQLLEKEKALVMYESLKQQLNPHFLFNSLTSLEGLIEADQQLAAKFLAGMSKIYRYILKNRDNELVSLKDDLAMVQVYITLQQTRFEKGLRVEINVHHGDIDKKIPPVTLQNLVENAIKHNIIDEERPLIICIESDGEHLTISNNLQKKKKVETSNAQGLSSLKALYKYLSHQPMEIKETAERFTVRLPLIY